MWCKALVLTVFALCLHQGEALKCHQCTSASDPKCGDPIDSSMELAECTPNLFKETGAVLKNAADSISGFLGNVGIDANLQVPDASEIFACVKAVRQDGDKKVVIRSCSVPKNDKFDICTKLKSQSGGGVVTFCETCDSDGCNSASGLAPLSFLVLVVAAMVALIAKQ